jgi:ABC-type nitrate/sulfonate/bicarbonate transport system ATPase subunit
LNDVPLAGEFGQIEVRIAYKAFTSASGERFEVLRDLNFRFGQHQVAALVGPSGCGKTTILRIIAGLETDFEGTITWPLSGRLGMVFQEPRLLPWRTVEDNVGLVAPRITREALASLFRDLDLEAHRLHYPGELSLGLARRVALARALAIEPSLLLLDEPLVSLDEALAVRLRDQLAALIESRPITTLLVTHDLEEAIRLADRIFLLSPRPAQVVAEIPLTAPRSARSEREVARIVSEVACRMTESALRPGHA